MAGPTTKTRRWGEKCQVARGYSLYEAIWAIVEKARAVKDLELSAEQTPRSSRVSTTTG